MVASTFRMTGYKGGGHILLINLGCLHAHESAKKLAILLVTNENGSASGKTGVRNLYMPL